MHYYGEWMKQQAFKRIGHLYPKVQVPKEQGGGEAMVIAWIWARTVKSPDPLARGTYVPLVSSMMLSTKKGNKSWVEIINDDNAEDGWRFIVKTGDLSKDLEKAKSLGTKAGKAKDFICYRTHSVIQREYIQQEGKAGHLSRRLMAIVALGERGRIYLSPTHEHEMIALSAEESSDVLTARETFLAGSIPTRAMITGGVCSAYGLNTWGSLFTDRQIEVLQTFCDIIQEVQKKVESDAIKSGLPDDCSPIADGGNGAKAYGDAVGVYLPLVYVYGVHAYKYSCFSGCCGFAQPAQVRYDLKERMIYMSLFDDFFQGTGFNSLGYCVDIVMLIDATGSMSPIIEEVKRNAMDFCRKFHETMEAKGKNVDELRVKVIPFRDYAYDGEMAMGDSGFFSLPDQNTEFQNYVNSIDAQGGGDEPESALEAIALAMRSDWTTMGSKRRHVILVFTDAPAAPLQERSRTSSPFYPPNMPQSLEELGDMWSGGQGALGMPEEQSARLIIFAPDVYPWKDIQTWNYVWVAFSKAGTGLGEVDIDLVFQLLTNSVA